MGRFIVRRLLQMIGVLFAVSVLTFLIFQVIPNGDPAVRMAGRHPSQSTIDAIRKEWHFDFGDVHRVSRGGSRRRLTGSR